MLWLSLCKGTVFTVKALSSCFHQLALSTLRDCKQPTCWEVLSAAATVRSSPGNRADASTWCPERKLNHQCSTDKVLTPVHKYWVCATPKSSSAPSVSRASLKAHLLVPKTTGWSLFQGHAMWQPRLSIFYREHQKHEIRNSLFFSN